MVSSSKTNRVSSVQLRRSVRACVYSNDKPTLHRCVFNVYAFSGRRLQVKKMFDFVLVLRNCFPVCSLLGIEPSGVVRREVEKGLGAISHS